MSLEFPIIIICFGTQIPTVFRKKKLLTIDIYQFITNESCDKQTKKKKKFEEKKFAAVKLLLIHCMFQGLLNCLDIQVKAVMNFYRKNFKSINK